MKNVFAKEHVKSAVWGIVTGVIVALVLFYILVGVGIRQYGWDGQLIHKVVKVTRHPAIMVDYNMVSYNEFLNDVDALTHFTIMQNEALGVQTPVNKDEIKYVVLQQFINKELVESRLRSYGESITDEQVELEIKKIIEEVGSMEALENELDRLYQWDIETFKEKIIRFSLAQELLAQKFAEDETVNEEVTNFGEYMDMVEESTSIVRFVKTIEPPTTY